MSLRVTEVRYGERMYYIPEMWLVGQTQQGRTILEAVAHWAWQTELAEREGDSE